MTTKRARTSARRRRFFCFTARCHRRSSSSSGLVHARGPPNHHAPRPLSFSSSASSRASPPRTLPRPPEEIVVVVPAVGSSRVRPGPPPPRHRRSASSEPPSARSARLRRSGPWRDLERLAPQPAPLSPDDAIPTVAGLANDALRTTVRIPARRRATATACPRDSTHCCSDCRFEFDGARTFRREVSRRLSFANPTLGRRPLERRRHRKDSGSDSSAPARRRAPAPAAWRAPRALAAET